MALAIWIAALVDRPFRYFSGDTLLWIVGILVAATVAAMVFRLARGASLADIHPSRILDAWFLVRFAAMPATFLLFVLWLIASAAGLAFAGTLGEAAMITVLFGLAAILLTSTIADTAAAIRGPGRAPPSDG